MTRRTFRLNLEPLEDRTLLATCTVTNLSDLNVGRVGMSIGSGDTAGNLRFCINRANALPGPDVIDINVTGTINLKGPLPALASDIDIQGPGADALTIRRDTGGNYRVFDVTSGVTVAISGVTMSNGHATGNTTLDGGGGIRNQGTLLVIDSVIENSQHFAASIAKGGGIYNRGDLTVIRSTIRDNDVFFGDYRRGAGIYSGSASGSSVSIYDSTITNNDGQGDPPVGANWSTGGAVYTEGANDFLLIVNSTIHANVADDCGGVAAAGLTIISHSTITDNTSFDLLFGGVCNRGDEGTQIYMRNTIVAGNNEADIAGSLTASDYNLIGNTNGGEGFGPTDILNVDPMLGPLQDNGGPTFTRALLPGSPAIDAGDNTDAPEFDQRGPGFPRIVNGTIDIGAFEVQSSPVPAAGRIFAFLITAQLENDE